MHYSSVLFVIVGASGSGKGLLLHAVRDMGPQHITVIPKMTTRTQKATDSDEMICGRPLPFPAEYDILYGNYKATYGIPTCKIWNALLERKHALLICSNFASLDEGGRSIPGLQHAIPALHDIFGPAIKLVYLHSRVTEEAAERHARQIATEDEDEIAVRKGKVIAVRRYYVDNIGYFNHVLLNVGESEDLTDQMFRLVRWYGGGLG